MSENGDNDLGDLLEALLGGGSEMDMVRSTQGKWCEDCSNKDACPIWAEYQAEQNGEAENKPDMKAAMIAAMASPQGQEAISKAVTAGVLNAGKIIAKKAGKVLIFPFWLVFAIALMLIQYILSFIAISLVALLIILLFPFEFLYGVLFSRRAMKAARERHDRKVEEFREKMEYITGKPYLDALKEMNKILQGGPKGQMTLGIRWGYAIGSRISNRLSNRKTMR
jgi:hypothetical protein